MHARVPTRRLLTTVADTRTRRTDATDTERVGLGELGTQAELFADVELSTRTVAEVLADLNRRGAAARFSLQPATIPPCVDCSPCHRHHLIERIQLLDAHRFDMPDGDGDAVLLTLRCPKCRDLGALVTSTARRDGAAPQEIELLTKLSAIVRNQLGALGHTAGPDHSQAI